MHDRCRALQRSLVVLAFALPVAACVPVPGPGDIDFTASATTTTVSCSGVSVAPGANVQNVLNAYSTGTTFCFKAGTYVLTKPVVPKSYQRLISVQTRGAILTGNGTYNAGVRGYGGTSGQHHVTVSGFKFTGFANVMGSSQVAALMTGDNWTVTGNEISYNTEIGASLNNGNTMRNNFIHHNGRYGFSAGPVHDVLIENNEVSYNNTKRYAIGNAGGSKILKSTRVTVRGNKVHDNYGNGLHTDTDNIYITYENNVVTNNYGVGIFHENSADATIRYNTVSRNNLRLAGKTLYYGADIFLNDSKNTQIYGNTVTAGVHGIGLYDNDRGSGKYGLYEVRNVTVRDNVVTTPSGGRNGLVGPRSAAYSSTGANRFSNNRYYVSSTAATTWEWKGSRTWPAWRSFGNDLTGSVTRTA
jgi:parallel beta-helix repeat protein